MLKLSRRVSNPADVSRVFHHDNPVSRDLLSEGPGFEDAAHQYAQREADYQKSDWQEAAKWYQKSADQGFADAEYSLGSMYFSGHAVQQDDAEAFNGDFRCYHCTAVALRRYA